MVRLELLRGVDTGDVYSYKEMAAVKAITSENNFWVNFVNILVSALSGDSEAYKASALAMNKALKPGIEESEKQQMGKINKALDIMDSIDFL